MTKPSTRIMQVVRDRYAGEYIELPNAIMNYLDEQYEKNKPCEHEEHSDSRFGHDIQVCHKCKTLGFFNKK